MTGGRTVIVGAGLAGLAAARRLADAGEDVVVVDENRWVGGRLGTRYVGKALVDHGAQFFTARTEVFGAWVEELQAAGIVYEWCKGFGKPDGYSRFAAHNGMAELARSLARDLDVTLDVAVTSVSAEGSGWRVAIDGRDDLDAAAVVLTPPVPISLRLLQAGEVELTHDEAEGLPEITYEPTLALVAVLDGESKVPDPGGVQLDAGPFSFVADNQAKGLSPVPALTLHATAEMSLSLWDDSDAKVQASLLSAAEEWIGNAHVVDTRVTRWRHAAPRFVWTDRYCRVADAEDGPVLMAGDAFAGPRVEGAWLSGHAAAGVLLG